MTDETTNVPADASSAEPQATQNNPQQPQPAITPVPVAATQNTPDISLAGSFPHDDFTGMLAKIKLPERHEFKARADAPKANPTEPEPKILEEHVTKVGKVATTAPRNTATPSTQETNTAPAVIVPPSPVAKIPPTDHINELSSSIVTPLRTLKDDLQSIVRDKKISLVHAVSLEEEKKRGQDHIIAPEQQQIRSRRSHRTFGIVFTSIILVFLGGAAIFGVFFVTQERQTPVAAPTASILFAEQTVGLSLDNQSAQTIKNELAQARTQSLGALGSITEVVPTLTSTSTDGSASVRPATIQEFFKAIGANPPQELLQAIGPNFFFGIHVVDKNAPLFVIPVNSYDHAFAGMLAWEHTMNADLAPIFTPVPSTQVGSNGIPEARTFQDTILRNYDIRSLSDDYNNIELYYSFPTPNVLIIAEDPNSFTEILSRLQAERKL